MIQNLFILRNSIVLVNLHSGEHNVLEDHVSLLGGYISALESFGHAITGTKITSMNFEEVAFHFYKDPRDSSLTYLLVTDLDVDHNIITSKMNKISDLFYKEYSEILDAFAGVLGPFKGFTSILKKMKIVE